MRCELINQYFFPEDLSDIDEIIEDEFLIGLDEFAIIIYEDDSIQTIGSLGGDLLRQVYLRSIKSLSIYRVEMEE